MNILIQRKFTRQVPDPNSNTRFLDNPRIGSLLTYQATGVRLRDTDIEERDIGERDIPERDIRERDIGETVATCLFAV